MSYIKSHNFRSSDFTAAVWFKPSQQGGLDKQTNSSWIAANTTVRLDGNVYCEARCAPMDDWIVPGAARNCGISEHNWRDDFRSAIEIGTSVELLLEMDAEVQGPPRCIGLGRIAVKHDPHARRFTADAEAEISLKDTRWKADLPGKLVQLVFADPRRAWIAHFDSLMSNQSGTSADLTENVFLLSLNHQIEGPYQNECDHNVGERFTIWIQEEELGFGVIKNVQREWGINRLVCYPEGWDEVGGLKDQDWSKC